MGKASFKPLKRITSFQETLACSTAFSKTYIEFHENRKNGLVADIMSKTDGHTTIGTRAQFNMFSFLLRKECLVTDHLLLCREVPAVCSTTHRKHINTLYGQSVEFFYFTLGTS
jgi:hypothetical protein